MNACRIVEKLPSAEEYSWLREQVGWRLHTLETVRKALPHSLFGVCAYQEERLVGMARVIGDGGLAYYIQDVIVLPECQRQGIGALLMERVMAYIRAQAGHHAVIGLMAAQGKEEFYERYGFTRRPNETLGAGMTIFWKGTSPG